MALLALLVLESTFSISETALRIVPQGCTLSEEFVTLVPSHVQIALMLTLAPLVRLIICWSEAVLASLDLIVLLDTTWMLGESVAAANVLQGITI